MGANILIHKWETNSRLLAHPQILPTISTIRALRTYKKGHSLIVLGIKRLIRPF